MTVQQAEQWHKHTRSAFALHTFRGGHFYLRGKESVLLNLMLSMGNSGAMP